MGYPSTPKQVVSEKYHGVQVEDPYRWLENASDAQVQAWTRVQNELTRTAVPQHVRHPQQHLLVNLGTAMDPSSEQVVLDPNRLDPSGGTAIDFYVPSHDGRLAAVCLSKGGSEDGSLYFYDTETGQALGDVVPRVNYPTGGGSATWNEDNSRVYYTRYPQGEERPAEDSAFYQQVFFHRLGTSSQQDQYVLGAGFPRIAETELHSTTDAHYVLALVRNGDGGEMAHYLRGPEGAWTQVTQFEDQAQDAVLGEDGHLYLLSRQNAPLGKIIRVPFENPNLAEAETVIPEQKGAIRYFKPAASLLYVVLMEGGPSRLVLFDLQGQPAGEVPTEPVSAIYDVVTLDGDEMLYYSGSYLIPPAWYRYHPMSGRTERTAMVVSYPVDFSGLEVTREYAVSRDGTKVPLNIIHRKGLALDGQNPTLLTGYGGYGISLQPGFVVRNKVWFDAGGVFAVANLRGGGEYGEAWHRAGNLENKQNVFDDFIACAEHLIRRRYTSPEKLAIIGGSNGGLLMGAAFTQRPDLFRAVVSMVGLYDMMRVENEPNGAFNVTEFGTITNPRQFEALYDYSPYHHVEDGKAYPAVLFTTGENDGRVNPAHSRKMTARMQAASASGLPVLLRTNAKAGHGIGTALEDRIEEDTDIFTFLMSQVGAQPGG